jgi:hypothetical protein
MTPATSDFVTQSLRGPLTLFASSTMGTISTDAVPHEPGMYSPRACAASARLRRTSPSPGSLSSSARFPASEGESSHETSQQLANVRDAIIALY